MRNEVVFYTEKRDKKDYALAIYGGMEVFITLRKVDDLGW